MTSALMRMNEECLAREVPAVESAIDSLLSAPAKVDFYSVAKVSGISRSTLYRNARLRAMVESARDSQPDPWELVRQLRDENASLHERLDAASSHGVHASKVEYTFVMLPCAA